METFKHLGVEDNLLRTINSLGIKTPTEIQRKTIPKILEGRDIVAESATGSGKTLAFSVGMIQNMEKTGKVQALILAPTRELAEQIHRVITTFSSYKKLFVTTIYGGVGYEPQIKALENADIVVGTPGRTLDLLERRILDLSDIKYAVLDEADRMLDMGFLLDVKLILKRCPEVRQNLLFSATMSHDITKLARKFMSQPERISAKSYVDASKLEQVFYNITNNLKFSLLYYLLKKEQKGLVMVFCNSRRYADIVSEKLTSMGMDAMAIHGGLTQAKRQKVLDRFNSKHSFILVCTDVAARGLDIPGVSHVYNYDIPDDSKQYIHRIGRTARAGKTGKVVNILCPKDHDNFNRVMSDSSLKIKEEKRPFLDEISLDLKRHVRKEKGRGGSTRSRGGANFENRGDYKPRGSYDGNSSGRSGTRRGSRGGTSKRDYSKRRDDDYSAPKFGVRNY